MFISYKVETAVSSDSSELKISHFDRRLSIFCCWESLKLIYIAIENI